ncbi:XRE family transcriptional regulator [Clostridioides difficile]|uniref:helix-turn-helix domain-containing protein n=1 Tax=Clostridioides TaxID=1870884 RepID=UPI001C1CE8DC|nr:helix-turn-helix transcriptional regulator [Clostridioides difficile]MCC0648305.1 helix-turn-helix transcriptional regulator [Clostridioides sp. ZZV15-6598]MBY2228997.1 helix-turn-helix transcriptional regulator [Clostridioides difficile]MDB3084166.1 XRE family transcriptional regulator [Clostridioides difficile]UUV16693.1 helix-turn-helix transcriptional regulator [Clostridioides difficile]HBF4081589.1 helix-turn-helix transcriptional regulator [Clostridioides difficile]
MIRIKISELLGKYKMSRIELSEKTGIRPSTITALYNETIKRIDIDMLDKLCDVFDCNIEDIIEHVKNVD